MQEKPNPSEHPHFYEAETEPMQALGTVPNARVIKHANYIALHESDLVNQLIRRTSASLYIRNVPGIHYPCRVKNIRPDRDHPGFFIALCSTVSQGDVEIQVGNGVRFDFYFV